METKYVIDFSSRVYKITMVFAIILTAGVLVFAMGQLNPTSSSLPHEVSFTGEGKAYAKPDVAVVTLGVHSDAPKSQDAVTKNNEKMNAILRGIKEAGVLDQDIKTTLYSLNPTYGTDTSSSMYPYPGVNSKVVGYSLDQQLEVKIRDLTKMNPILDKATSLGATNVGSLQFVVDRPEAVQAEARAQAISKAKMKMKDIVARTGINIGELVGVSEGYSNYPQPMYGIGGGGAMKDSASVAPQIQTGQQEVTSTITLTYKVR